MTTNKGKDSMKKKLKKRHEKGEKEEVKGIMSKEKSRKEKIERVK